MSGEFDNEYGDAPPPADAADLRPFLPLESMIPGETVERTDGFRLGEVWITKRDDHGDINTYITRDGKVVGGDWVHPLQYFKDFERKEGERPDRDAIE